MEQVHVSIYCLRQPNAQHIHHLYNRIFEVSSAQFLTAQHIPF